MIKLNQCIQWLAVAVIAPVLLLTACTDKAPVAGADNVKQAYTCPMHPQIVRNEPGSCPVCGMDLVPFNRDSQEDALLLNESQQQLANITTAAIATGKLSAFTQLNGRLAVNPQATAYISSRVPGRIEALYVKETGIAVRKGQPLYKIYSEQLAAMQQEYLVTAAQVAQFPDDEQFRRIFQASRNRLLLYDMTEAQLQTLASSRQTNPFVTYPAPADGVVSELSVTEGQYVGEGGNIMRLEGYDRLWVEADVYPAEALQVRAGQQVEVVIPGWENQPQNMTISFISPALQPGSQLLQIRGSIPNANNQWQPGLQAFVMLPSAGNGRMLTLPANAVIREENGMHVWVESAKGKFTPRMVTTGMETADQVEITGGLEEGENVVITGAYLLYSEYILKKGKHPMAAHNH